MTKNCEEDACLSNFFGSFVNRKIVIIDKLKQNVIMLLDKYYYTF